LKDGADLRPKWAVASARLMGHFLSTGSAFLAMQLIVAVNVASDNLIVAWALGPRAVTQFSVPERVFGLVPMLIHLGLQPLWPAYAEARTRGDSRWVATTLRRSLVFSFIASAGPLLSLLFVGGPLIRLWTANAVTPSVALLAGLVLWKIVDSAEYALSVNLSSAGRLRPQIVFSGTAAAVALALKLALITTFPVSCVPWLSAGARIVLSFGPLLYLSLHINRTNR
jgi:O-antigen/teichoic acid export membrane protein